MASPDGTRTFIAECYAPHVRPADLAEIEGRVRAAVEQVVATSARGAEAPVAADGSAVAYLGAILIPADETVFHRFSAPSAAAVEAVARRAAIGLVRIVESVTAEG